MMSHTITTHTSQDGHRKPVHVALKPGAPVVYQMSAAVDKKIRAGARRISVKHFRRSTCPYRRLGSCN
jgi:hypothetical protein